MCPIIRGSAGEDAVVVAGKTLRFHESLTAAVRTGCEIGVFRRVAVEGLGGGFADGGHLVNGAVTEVDDFFGMAESPCGVASAGSMTGVSGGRSVAPRHGESQCTPVNFSGEAAIAQSAEFAVPAARGHPDFNFDFGVGRRLGNCADPAKRRKPLIECGIADKPRRSVSRWSEGTSRDRLR